MQKRHTDRKMYFHDLEVTSKDYYIGYVSTYTTLTSENRIFLKHIKAYLKERGILFVGFPAWQMPFGGHQQICRSKLCSHLPFIHLLPEFLYKSLLRLCGEEYGTVKELESIKECRTSIELFEALASDCGYLTVNKRYWLVNPHYKQKFNLTPLVLPHWIGRLKYIRNFFTTSCWYILR